MSALRADAKPNPKPVTKEAQQRTKNTNRFCTERSTAPPLNDQQACIPCHGVGTAQIQSDEKKAPGKTAKC
ncbi:MAG: hypothetical protein NWS28_08710 [Limnohabitans sp.]|jgi:hypothetical protein|nr:hypothetical protein [Limnohabitans sp.]